MKYLLKEHNNEFTIDVETHEEALLVCELYNAVIIKEI